MRRRALTSTVVATVGLLLAGCGSSGTADISSTSATSSAALSGTVKVFVAAPLKEAFTTLAGQFELANPGTRVVFTFGLSSALAAQITTGAPADVFASAGTENMDQVIKAGAGTYSANFASNVLEIAVPPANEANVTELSDLASPEVRVALCRKVVACGAKAAEVFAKAKLTVTPLTQEVDAAAVLTKVALGQVDAGVVYGTDVRAAGAKVKGVPIPAEINVPIQYPIAVLKRAPNTAAAQGFINYVLNNGAKVLASNGFAKP